MPRNVMMTPTGRVQDDLKVVAAEKKRQMIPTINMKMELIRYLGSLLRPLFLKDIVFIPPTF